MSVYSINVAGESFDNRQKNIGRMSKKDAVNLFREKGNPYDENAIRVSNRMGVLGYINRDDARWISEHIDEGRPIEARIESIGEGDSGLLGVILEVRTDEDINSRGGKVRIEVYKDEEVNDSSANNGLDFTTPLFVISAAIILYIIFVM